MTTFDYIVVGAGTAGCVLANRLTANGKYNVLLIEAGKKDNYFWINIPVGYLYTINNPRTDWCYEIEPDPGLNGRSIGYARGKVLGGCSSINAMIYMRGQRSDYDHWAQLGNLGWSWDDVLPVFKHSEDYQHGADEFHGAGGEMRVEERRVNWEILDAWRDAAADSGIPKIAEFNRGDNSGNAYFQMNQRRGSRWSATKAFLDPAKARPNLTILTESHVQK
ncbi:MAG: GMC family oxidoreductase, partial [Pseudomonadales bacterium]|nr:GMC family oxidoreductase [Pseudomonadales bacterium]